MDSHGKLSEGILEGTTTSLGDYDECLDVIIGGVPKKHQTTGAYCLLEIKPPRSILVAIKDYQVNREESNYTIGEQDSIFNVLRRVRTNPEHMMFRLGICMPSSCTKFDVQDLIKSGIAIATPDADLPIEVGYCETKEDFHLQVHEIIILSCIFLCVALVIVGSFIQFMRNTENTSPTLKDPKICEEEENKCCRLWLSVKEKLSQFSISSNISKLFRCEQNGDAFDVTRGIVLLTIIFSIFFHTYALPHPLHMYRFKDTLNFIKFIDELLFGAVANSSVGVDTFFFLAGFYFVYKRWKLSNKPKTSSYVPKFIVLMFVRMTAAQVLVGALFFLLAAFGSGPLWNEFVQGPLNNCKTHWWMNLLYIQNFLSPYDICLYQTWFLATIMQLFLITSLVVLCMEWWPSFGVLVNVAVITFGILMMAALTAIAGHPATFSIYFYDYRTSIELWKYVYTQSYTHLGPQCIGMLVAFCLTEFQTKTLDKRLVFLVWVASILTMFSIIFGLHTYRNGEEMDRSLAVFYAAVHRPAWALAIGWIVYACATGYGGIINSFLTWKAFKPLERLSYMAYMLHIPIMYYHGGVQREKLFMGHYNQIMCFLAYVMASYFFAFICYILFQAPYEVVENSLCKTLNGEGVTETLTTETPKSAKSQVSTKEEEEKSKVLYSRY